MLLVTDESIDAKLADSRIKIDNASSNKRISEALALYNYDTARFEEGKSLYKYAMDLHQKKKTEFSEQIAATDAFLKEFSETDKRYMKDVRVAEVAFRGKRSTLLRAEIPGPRASTFTGWYAETFSFYTGILESEEALGLLQNYGITVEHLQANKDRIENVNLLKNKQVDESGDAQVATKARDAALDALLRWVADLVAIARVALSDEEQLLESMNIIVSP